MNQAYVIRQAIFSEKSYKLMEVGAYTFLVARHATKDDIAKAVEKQFSVKVAKVNVLKKASKTKRITGTRKLTSTQESKKALVYLAPGQNIEFLSPKKAKKEKSQDKKETKAADKGQETKEEKKTKSKGLLARIKKSK